MYHKEMLKSHTREHHLEQERVQVQKGLRMNSKMYNYEVSQMPSRITPLRRAVRDDSNGHITCLVRSSDAKDIEKNQITQC